MEFISREGNQGGKLKNITKQTSDDMLIDLPQPIQQQVIYYLEANNFIAAKELHDSYACDSNQQKFIKKEMCESIL
jgi:hypothetical protein